MIEGLLFEQFPSDDHRQPAAKLQLQCPRKYEASSVKPAATVFLDKRCKDFRGMSEAVQTIIHEGHGCIGQGAGARLAQSADVHIDPVKMVASHEMLLHNRGSTWLPRLKDLESNFRE